MMKALKVLGIDERQARASLLATAQSLLLILLSVGVSLVLFILFVLSLAFILLGIGLFTTPVIADAVRAHANQRRLFARDWSGVTIPAAYQPFPHRQRRRLVRRAQRQQFAHRATVSRSSSASDASIRRSNRSVTSPRSFSIRDSLPAMIAT